MNQIWRWVWSDQCLFSRNMLWLLFLTNALGTIYGYMWYWGQLVETAKYYDYWLLLFVPDSPTASLFFTISLGFMIAERTTGSQERMNRPWLKALRGFIDAFAIITLVKYGIWAVAMNLADGYQGGTISWKQWMLIVSHSGMALEALIYARLMRYGRMAIAAVAVWTLTNDYLDYHRGIHPYLFGPLEDDIAVIQRFTWSLSAFSIFTALLLHRRESIS